MNRDCFRLSFKTRMTAGSDEAELMLYGEIIQDMREDWKWSKEDKSAADFDKAIKSIRADGAKKLKLRINSPGGIVHEAVAMRAILTGAGFESINIHIEGLCASAATMLAAIPGAKVSISQGSEYMIHNPWTWAIGNAEDMEKSARHLRSMEESARKMYAQKTGKSDEQIKAWMDAETWFTAEEAVKNGFADEITAEEQPIAACVTPRFMSVMRSLYDKVPKDIRQAEEEEPKPQDDSNGKPQAASGEPTVYIKSTEEEETMDLTKLTADELRSGNPALYDAIRKEAAQAERERMQEIDDLTPQGGEELAAKAKAEGMNALDYHKAVIKAQREKGAAFLKNRKEETTPAAGVKPEAAEDDKKDEEAEMKAYAAEMAKMAERERADNGGMY